MPNNFSKQTAAKLKGLGIYQIAGGIIGLLTTAWLIAQGKLFSLAIILLFLVAMALYCYSIFCGILLLKQKAVGLKHSTINQFLQLVSFSIAGYAFQYISGIFLSAGINLANSFVGFDFNFGVSIWKISLNTRSEAFLININFVALCLVIFIDKLKKKVKEEEFEAEISQLGQ